MARKGGRVLSVTDAEQVGREAEQKGRQAEQSDTLDHLVRAGLVAYGVVHLLLAWLTMQLALGDHGQEASTSGAMSELAQQPFGKALVWAVAIGMFLLVLWRLLEAAFGHRSEEGWTRVGKVAMSLLKAGIYAVLAVTATKVALGSGGSGGSGSDTMTAKLMSKPGGQWLVVAVGLAIIGYAVQVAWRGWAEKFAENLDTEGKLGMSGAAYLLLGKFGHIGKGIALAIVGGLFVLETLSVIIQVVSYKTTGKRVFRMAPLHHHYEQQGWQESTVVVRFWIISVILALVGLATLKLR